MDIQSRYKDDINIQHQYVPFKVSLTDAHIYMTVTVVYLVLVVLVYYTYGLTVNLTRYGLASVEFDNINMTSKSWT